MRLLVVLILALTSSAVAARGVHKCQKPSGAVYYTDKACSAKNTRDRKPVFDQGADPQKPAPPPPQSKKKPKR
jgi:hypothetical protein